MAKGYKQAPKRKLCFSADFQAELLDPITVECLDLHPSFLIAVTLLRSRCIATNHIILML